MQPAYLECSLKFIHAQAWPARAWDRDGCQVRNNWGRFDIKAPANEDKHFLVCPRLPSERHATIHASSSHHRIIIFYERTKGIKHAIQTCQFACVAWREVEHQTYLKLDRRNFAYHKQWLFDFLDQSNDFQATTLAVGFHIFGRHKTNLEI
jgi:hypothetical protein